MAANNANAVQVAVTGSAYVGATGTAAPTTAVSALNVAFTELGYISADGITETRDRSTNPIRAWQNADLVREVVTESSATFKFTLLEATKEVVELYYGTSVVTATGSVEVNPGTTGGRKSFVFNAVDGAKVIRIYVPSGEVLAVEPVAYVNGEPVSFGVTVTAYSTGTFSYKRFQSDLVVA